LIVTTSNDETPELIERAKHLAKEMEANYFKRNKKTIDYLLQSVDAQIFVANSQRGLSFYKEAGKEIFFHPNMAFLRIKQLEQGQKDSLVTVCGLREGMSFFDGTIGLASDALVAAYAVGPTGKVIGTEASRPLYYLTTFGLDFYQKNHPEWQEVISRIQIKNMGNLDLLKQLEPKSVDVVYFDFMFEKSIGSSSGIQVIKSITSEDSLTREHIEEARRVAKSRIVAKSGYSGQPLQELGFTVEKAHKRRQFYYGAIEIETL